MVRMNEPLPVALQCHSSIIIPSFVKPGSSTARIGRPSKLAHVVGELAKSSFAFGKRRFGTFAFRDFLGNDIDAENVASGIFQWMPVRQPDTLCVTAVRSLAADFYAGDGLTGAENRLDDALDLIGNLRDRLSHGPADMVRNGNSTDLGQMPIDLEISAIRGEEGKSNRSGLVQKL
jgi:hypothetical protein